jgi:hypothetical protein
MIFTRPAAEKLLSNFKCTNDVMHSLSNLFTPESVIDCTVIRIESTPGNGSSHLLQALGNELKQRGARIAYLHFMETDIFSDLSSFHLSDILNSEFLLINHIHFLLAESSKDALLDFLVRFAKTGGKLLYTSKNTADIDEAARIEACFQSAGKSILLEPLTCDLRTAWAIEILGEKHASQLPETILTANGSNAEFLSTLKPILQEIQRSNGSDRTFNREFEQRINSIRLKLRKYQLSLAELQLDKQELIRKQLYEHAADLRQNEKELQAKIKELYLEVSNLKTHLPFEPGYLRSHYITEALLLQIDTDKPAMVLLNSAIQERMDTLESQWKELKANKQTITNRNVIEELMNWEVAIERFNKCCKK